MVFLVGDPTLGATFRLECLLHESSSPSDIVLVLLRACTYLARIHIDCRMLHRCTRLVLVIGGGQQFLGGGDGVVWWVG